MIFPLANNEIEINLMLFLHNNPFFISIIYLGIILAVTFTNIYVNLYYTQKS